MNRARTWFTLALSVTVLSTALVAQKVTITGAGSVTIRASQAGDDNYNPDKHFDARGAAPNSTGRYTWHWDNIEVYTTNQREQ